MSSGNGKSFGINFCLVIHLGQLEALIAVSNHESRWFFIGLLAINHQTSAEIQKGMKSIIAKSTLNYCLEALKIYVGNFINFKLLAFYMIWLVSIASEFFLVFFFMDWAISTYLDISYFNFEKALFRLIRNNFFSGTWCNAIKTLKTVTEKFEFSKIFPADNPQNH